MASAPGGRLEKDPRYYSKRPAGQRLRNKTELDVLKERHRFIRASDEDESTLSWDDQLAVRLYSTLFREFAVVNLKHFSSGSIALRWRTENEVLRFIGQRTCASLRCAYHLPPAGMDEDDLAELPDDEELVPVRLEEFKVPFGYMEDGQKKEAVVKLVLCPSCGKKLLKSREAAKPSPTRDERRRSRTGEREHSEARSSRVRKDEHESRRRERRRSSSPPPTKQLAIEPPPPPLPTLTIKGSSSSRFEPYQSKGYTSTSHAGRYEASRRSASPPERERKQDGWR